MAHPHKSGGVDAHNAKLRRMTRNYGSASGPDNNRLAAVENLKGNGPEAHVGFGADYDAVSSRSDKPARKSVATNPVATYARGGCVKPVAVATRARGGGLKHKGKGSTHVNVIVAPQGGTPAGAAGPMDPRLAQMAAAAAPKPPMPPAGGPPGAPPMGGAPGGAPPMMRKRGGKVHSDEAQDRVLIHKVLKSEGLERRAKGGKVEGGPIGHVPDTSYMRAGADSGVGRLQKSKDAPKPTPKAV